MLLLSVSTIFDSNTMQDFSQNKLCKLLGIKYPIIQAGMIWVSGAKLASAASNSGCLGTLGAGSMDLDVLKSHIQKTQASTTSPFAVNLPIMYHGIEKQLELCLALKVKIFITSAGSAKLFTKKIQNLGGKVFHVCSSPLLAQKCLDAGVDGIIVEGFEAGGHLGKDQLTTMVLVPQVKKLIKDHLPLVAAGGIASGEQMLACMALGADGVQIGSRFAVCNESSAHKNYKQAVCEADPQKTLAILKKIGLVRLLNNDFAKVAMEMEAAGSSVDELKQFVGKNRAKNGIFQGDLSQGKLEIGQVCGMISQQTSFKQSLDELLKEYNQKRSNI